MSVRLAGDVVLLEGHCRVEDAEPLSTLLQGPTRIVNLTGCRAMHSAVLQALLVFKPAMCGETGDAVLDTLLGTMLAVESNPAEL